MIKLLLLLGLVICSHCVLSARANDDEFAEFDEVSSEDSKHQKQSQQPREQVVSDSRQRPQPSDSAANKKVNAPNEQQPAANGAESSEQQKPQSPDNNNDRVSDDSSKSTQDQPQKRPDLKLVDAPLPRIYRWESYYIEILFLIASLLYFVNYFIGSGKNSSTALQWYEQSRELFKQQFALVGGAPQLTDGGQKRDEDGNPNQAGSKKQRGLIKSTESVYTLWNSGRVGLDGLLVEINLIKRQDLFSMAMNLLKPKKDALIFRFLLSQDGYENFVFCLAHKTQAARLARDVVDINTFCPKKKLISQFGVDSERLVVMSELSDVTSFIFDQKTLAFIRKYEQSINYIHITDQYSTNRSEEASPAQRLANSKRMATFSFDFPRNSFDQVEYISFTLSLLDRLRRFKLAKDSKSKSDKNRQKITDILQKSAFTQRQEAAQAKKEELRRLEKERIYNEDDPEKQRRWDKMEAKRELKKNKMRVKQLKVKSM